MQSIRVSQEDILQMETLYRAAFVNSLSGFKSASLIGTADRNGQSNLAIFSSVIHLGSNPALMGFINRPDSASRHTLENILETGYFTINHINSSLYQKAHQTSARYPKAISEFDAVGLTPEYHLPFPAPYVAESNIKYGLQLVERHDLKVNGTILIIGSVIEVFLPEICLQVHGGIDLEQAETITISGLDSYHATNRISRLSYAKPDKFPTEML